jgi:glycosyltransferase involved in cell wall biosynthesis
MVGYDHCWAPYRVFPSYAHQSVIYSNPAEQVQRYVWFDTVIPHFVDADEYWIAPRRGDYALFLGRDVPAKGKALAEFACQQAGLPLRVVHRGLAGPAKTELLAHAIAVLMPTVYLEPFGYVAVEAQMCGVPAITTDWGAFAETVEQGKTGFRCRTAAEFRLAIEQVRQLDPVYIRARAKALYSIEAAMPAYLAYFDFVWRTHRYGGFYAEHAVRWSIRQACTPASTTC